MHEWVIFVRLNIMKIHAESTKKCGDNDYENAAKLAMDINGESNSTTPRCTRNISSRA